MKIENGQDASDACAICFTDRLDEAPCVRLKCGHLFHFICVRTVLERRWSGPRILFRLANSPYIIILNFALSDLCNVLYVGKR